MDVRDERWAELQAYSRGWFADDLAQGDGVGSRKLICLAGSSSKPRLDPCAVLQLAEQPPLSTSSRQAVVSQIPRDGWCWQARVSSEACVPLFYENLTKEQDVVLPERWCPWPCARSLLSPAHKASLHSSCWEHGGQHL